MCWRINIRKRAFKKNSRLENKREIVEKYKDKFPVKTFVGVLGISRQRIYRIIKTKCLNIRKNKTMKNDKELLDIITKIVAEYSFYGYRKITAILKYKYNQPINRKRVYRIMKENNLLMPATRSNKKMFKGIPYSNKLATTRSSELWGIDMTYIWCGEDGWCYLHGVIDCHDKTLLGYYFGRSCKALGGIMALAEAASQREIESLELRSDNGCHYGAREFKREIRRLGINHTRTMVNTPKGNAVIERFFRSLKEECVWQHRFKNFEEAKHYVEQWIEFYNKERPHQTLKYLTPVEFYKINSLRNIA